MRDVIKTLEIVNRLGLHARAAAKLVREAGRFQARIILERDGQEVDAKSLLGILTLACPKGSHITMRAIGADARDALSALEALITRKFDEE